MSPWRRITLAGTMMAALLLVSAGPARPQPEGPRVEIKAIGTQGGDRRYGEEPKRLVLNAMHDTLSRD